jgi:hypothetical protein
LVGTWARLPAGAAGHDLSEVYATLSLVGYICSIRFPDGWVLHVRALYSQATYMGRLEGPHTALTNDRRIAGRCLPRTVLLQRVVRGAERP